ncbi:hypothetical protein ACL6C3_18710 [Capilliphycus salinus ALCB114379]|uniref:hypothetical protein n=1 Tax=Capilliphycus salinus TaxID=2768948 RepID=UPI0039A6344A
MIIIIINDVQRICQEISGLYKVELLDLRNCIQSIIGNREQQNHKMNSPELWQAIFNDF